jgi:hypothetical protein
MEWAIDFTGRKDMSVVDDLVRAFDELTSEPAKVVGTGIGLELLELAREQLLEMLPGWTLDELDALARALSAEAEQGATDADGWRRRLVAIGPQLGADMEELARGTDRLAAAASEEAVLEAAVEQLREIAEELAGRRVVSASTVDALDTRRRALRGRAEAAAISALARRRELEHMLDNLTDRRLGFVSIRANEAIHALVRTLRRLSEARGREHWSAAISRLAEAIAGDFGRAFGSAPRSAGQEELLEQLRRRRSRISIQGEDAGREARTRAVQMVAQLLELEPRD